MQHIEHSFRFWVTALTATMMLVACNGDDASAPVTGDHNSNVDPGRTLMLKPFTSTAELSAFTRQYEFRRGTGAGGKDAEGSLPPSASPTTGGTMSNGNFSHTNIQEVGVDEPDAVKTDGEYLYIASNDRVNIVDAIPANALNLVADIVVPGYVDKLMLSDGRLVILYHYSNLGDPGGVPEPAAKLALLPYAVMRTGVLIADVSDPALPVTLRHELFDGYFTAARRLDNALHLVVQHSPIVTLINDGGVVDGGGATDGIPALGVVAATRASDTAEVIPQHYRVEADGTLVNLGPLVDASQILHPDQPTWLNFVAIISIDLERPSRAVNAVAYLGNSAVVYMSSQALYIAQSDGTFAGLPIAVDGSVVEAAVAARALATSSTQIHKFSLRGAAVQASASGSVPGALLNQYGLSEHNGFLRAATTDFNVGSAVYVLEQVEATLDVAGKVENIAPNERMYAARFLGDRGFLVTFEQIDPFFTLDLANPRAPVLVGELKVPGFSEYLHPIDATHVLAMGYATREVGGRIMTEGVQISLFDVTDFTNPQLMDSVAWEANMSSEASYNPLAFNYWAETKLLALPMVKDISMPVSVEGNITPTATNSALAAGPSSGAMVYTVDIASGVIERGRLTSTRHDYPSWSRALFIGDYTYYVRNDAVDVAATSTLANIVASLELTPLTVAPPPIGGGGGGGVSPPSVPVQ